MKAMMELHYYITTLNLQPISHGQSGPKCVIVVSAENISSQIVKNVFFIQAAALSKTQLYGLNNF